MKQIIDQINKVFEQKTRLGIMSALMVNDSTDFLSLRSILGVTDGNLSSNITVLEKLKFVKVTKKIIAKKMNTSYSLTATGRKAFKSHIEALEKLIRGLE